MGIPFHSHHRAGADAEACAKVFIKSLELSGVADVEELQSKYEFRCGRFADDIFEGQRSVKKSVSAGIFYIHSGQHLLLRLLVRSVFSRRPISSVLALLVH